MGGENLGFEGKAPQTKWPYAGSYWPLITRYLRFAEDWFSFPMENLRLMGDMFSFVAVGFFEQIQDKGQFATDYQQ